MSTKNLILRNVFSSSSSQDEFFTIYGNDIHDTGNNLKAVRNTIRFYKRSREVSHLMQSSVILRFATCPPIILGVISLDDNINAISLKVQTESQLDGHFTTRAG
ncbi:hypothetical protein CEXT_178191 [Caerostris extrusa]|uniref:Uncharacterized protein n=1 Tax=Caerostris extrusa TaxID=172846 RepID=A0AAV4NVX1_CAEEX|nr:hypothetical protein CEXT_178191 [Caerostris extrusa]